jgi:hypothetical protein
MTFRSEATPQVSGSASCLFDGALYLALLTDRLLSDLPELGP